VRTLDDYNERLDERVVPVLRGIALDADDLVRRDGIQRLMCRFALDVGAIEAAHGIRFDQYFAPEVEALTAWPSSRAHCGDGVRPVPQGAARPRTLFAGDLRHNKSIGRHA
jgi:coproporphyrinogen III oxidase-like Fe-S oxidoreductase